MSDQLDNAGVIERADDLFSQEKWRDMLELLLPYTETEDVELLWRVVRAHQLVGKRSPRNRQETEQLLQKAMEMMERGIQLNETHFQMHKVAY